MIKWKMKNKKGSIIIEAAITIPFFLIVCCSLIMLINVIKTCNDIVFKTSKEIRDISSKALYSKELSELSVLNIYNSINIEDKNCEYKITDFDFAFIDGNYDELILIASKTNFKSIFSNITGMDIRFDLNVLSRAFVGKRLESNGLDPSRFVESGNSGFVVIFPRYGIRYHADGCKYVTQYQYSNEFMLIIDREEAILRGYTPCLVCNGGNVYE